MALQDEDSHSEDAVSNDGSESSGWEMQDPPPPRIDIDEKDAEEEELERLVLGDKAGFRENLFKKGADVSDDLRGLSFDDAAGTTAAARITGFEEADDSNLFFYDSTSVPGRTPQLFKTETAVVSAPESDPNAPAWEDSDDERLSVSLAGATRLRKLRTTEGEDIVSGAEYTRRLRQQYLRLNPLPGWAVEGEKRLSKRRRRSSTAAAAASSDVSSDSEEDGEDGGSSDEDETALPLGQFLRSAGALASVGAAASRKKRRLRPEVIDIQKTRDIPDPHRGPVTSLGFHPSHPVLLSSSLSSVLHLHHVAPSAHPTPNPLLTSVQVKRTPIRRAAFSQPGGEQIFFAGRRRYFHSWDVATGLVRKVSRVQGHRLEHRTMERFRLSPDGAHMAIIASERRGGGILNILAVGTMQWVAQARLESRGGIADFAWWRTGEGITVLGRDGGVGEWSLEAKRFLGTWRDEGSTGGRVLALGGQLGPSALGGDRWVAVGSNSGILNLYDRNSLVLPSKGGGGGVDGADDADGEAEVEIAPLPQPVRAFEQLTTPVTQAAFTPDGQLLAFASQYVADALRLAHVESATVYRNWPTDQTPLGRITALAFNPGSDMLAVGNDNGKVRLWEIRS